MFGWHYLIFVSTDKLMVGGSKYTKYKLHISLMHVSWFIKLNNT